MAIFLYCLAVLDSEKLTTNKKLQIEFQFGGQGLFSFCSLLLFSSLYHRYSWSSMDLLKDKISPLYLSYVEKLVRVYSIKYFTCLGQASINIFEQMACLKGN